MSVIDDATLLKMAEAELIGEAKKAAVRHSIAGISGWQPCPKPNKVFLTNTLLQTISGNRIISRKLKNKKSNTVKLKTGERKLMQKSKNNEKTNFIFQKPGKSKNNDSEVCNKKENKAKKVQDFKYCKKLKNESACKIKETEPVKHNIIKSSKS